jgi:zinc protease
MKTATLCLALSILAAAKELPPAGGAPKPFQVPPSQTYQLKNGLRVSLVEYGKLPLVSIRAVMEFGNANESSDQVWLTDLLALLMVEGAAGRNGKQLAEEAANMGGQLAVGAGFDTTIARLNVLGEFAANGVRLLSDVVTKPDLPGSELERLRSQLIRKRTVDLSDPGSIAEEAFAKQMYGEHPYGRLFPSEDSLKSYKLDDVRKFYAANAGARRSHLYVAGKFSTAAVRKAIAESFESWKPGPDVVRKTPSKQAEKSFTLVDRPGAEQSVLRIGLPLPVNPTSPDYFAFKVTDSILGGSFGSRITSNIREQKGYTYSPFSYLDVNYHSMGWVEGADVTTKVTSESIKEILFEINRMRKEPPAAEELRSIQNYISGVFILQNSSNAGIIGQLSFVDEQGLGPDYLRTYVQKINAVTRADVQRIAERFLDPNKMAIVVVGDQTKIGASLAPFK